ncbi:MAG: zinc transporter ZupT [Candidatus Coatesbacteria bacterium 4484_99]|uniref:Zinc transporter ZupT n=1 Tax=Candidatus Coatesbacteria bacterium 4484_99 TaxID=1970774 RepID=A0A1W9S0A7_9BACT|nr:MAG: zinc transporter ZupT [Candidatus Coatesbacteria bacterium 4484_99]RLC40562.1 MAG: zinc transporter ZupT [Candidatus Coatesbacteria bacterium]
MLFAFLLTLFAGLSTGIGSFIAFFVRRSQVGFLSFGLGASAGVMIYISLVEMLSKAQESVALSTGGKTAGWIVIGSFFLGILISALIDHIVPKYENPHEVRSTDELSSLKTGETALSLQSSALRRASVITALAIAIHNFPEGLATFLSTLADPAFGISVAVAIAVHNIPEGISVSVPYFYATGSRGRAFVYSFLSGLAEPAGAMVGYFILRPFMDDIVMGMMFGVIAGIMVFISFDQLLPMAREYGKGHTAILGVIFGMGIMAVSLLLF